ncbi:MAG: hypothetical protein AB3N20_01320 [Rhizobiaceae bacterium]
MCKLEVIDRISACGSANRANEDALGSNDHAAFVIDGATGLGDNQVMPDAGSDAAWLAGFAAARLAKGLTFGKSVPAVIRDCIMQAKSDFLSASQGDLPARYAWPSASFIVLQIIENGIRFSGLGDCVAYTFKADKTVTFSPLLGFSEVEKGWASHHIGKTGGFGDGSDLLSNPETLEDLRTARALQNTAQSGVWTLGLEPGAADHLLETNLEISGPTYSLLCSDGFAALVDTYNAYTPETLVETAISGGLNRLLGELRHIEEEVDPDGQRFPRFKRSDDATAMLLRLS